MTSPDTINHFPIESPYDPSDFQREGQWLDKLHTSVKAQLNGAAVMMENGVHINAEGDGSIRVEMVGHPDTPNCKIFPAVIEVFGGTNGIYSWQPVPERLGEDFAHVLVHELGYQPEGKCCRPAQLTDTVGISAQELV